MDEKLTSEANALAALIRQARGRVKRRPGEKPFAEQMAEYKREEIALEDAKLERLTQAGLLPVHSAKLYRFWTGGLVGWGLNGFWGGCYDNATG